VKVAKPTQRYTAEEAQALLANSTPGRGDGVIRRDHRTLYAGLPGEGADAENVREYEIGVAHIATGDAKLFAAAPGLAVTVVAQAQEIMHLQQAVAAALASLRALTQYAAMVDRD